MSVVPPPQRPQVPGTKNRPPRPGTRRLPDPLRTPSRSPRPQQKPPLPAKAVPPVRPNPFDRRYRRPYQPSRGPGRGPAAPGRRPSRKTPSRPGTRNIPGQQPRSVPRPGLYPGGDPARPQTTPGQSPNTKGSPTPKPGTNPLSQFGRGLIPAILLELTTSVQEKLAGDIIDATELTDDGTETKKVSDCFTMTEPPCFGFGCTSTRFVAGAFEQMEKLIDQNELHFALSALSSRVFMRIFEKLVDRAKDDLEAIIKKGVQCPPEPEDVCRVKEEREVEVCLRMGDAPRGTSR